MRKLFKTRFKHLPKAPQDTSDQVKEIMMTLNMARDILIMFWKRLEIEFIKISCIIHFQLEFYLQSKAFMLWIL
jgi:thymidylate synthase